MEGNSHENWRGAGSANKEHVRDLAIKLSGLSTEAVVIKPNVSTQLCLEEYSQAMVESNLMQVPLNMSIAGEAFSLEIQGLVTRVGGDEGGKKNVNSVVQRQYSMFCPSDTWNSVSNSGPSCGSDIGGDLIANDLSGVGWKYNDGACISSLHGSDISLFDYENIHGLLGIKYKTCDYRMLALKGVLLLNQLNTLYTFSQSNISVRCYNWTINPRSPHDVLRSCIEHSLVIDASKLQENECELLYYLTRKWPFQVCMYNGTKDIYSSIIVDEDDVVLYTSHQERLNGAGRGIVIPPDDLFQRLVNLFTALGAVDQLFEVMRDIRGFVPFLRFNMAERGIGVTLRYPKVTGTNSFQGIIGRCDIPSYTLVSQFMSSSAHLLLDVLMGVQMINNIHCIGESMGIYNSKMFNDDVIDDANARIISLMRDYGFTHEGPRNTLVKMIMPWSNALLCGGRIMRQALYNYQAAVRGNAINNVKEHFGTCLILTKFTPAPIPLSTSEAVRGTQVFDMQSKGTHLSAFNSNGIICKLVNWGSAVGLDATGVCYGGLTWMCEESFPNICEVLRARISAMNGEYALTSVTTIVLGAATRRGATSGHVSNLFRHVTHAEGQHISDINSDPTKGTSTSRLFKTSTGTHIASKAPRTSPFNATTDEVVDKEEVVAKALNEIATGHKIGEQVIGDGDCGLHALAAAMADAGGMASVNSMLGIWEIEPRTGYHQRDDDLAALAAYYGFNLLLRSSQGDIYYDANKQGNVVLYHEGGNHWRPGVRSKLRGDGLQHSVLINRKIPGIDDRREAIQKEIAGNRKQPSPDAEDGGGKDVPKGAEQKSKHMCRDGCTCPQSECPKRP